MKEKLKRRLSNWILNYSQNKSGRLFNSKITTSVLQDTALTLMSMNKLSSDSSSRPTLSSACHSSYYK